MVVFEMIKRHWVNPLAGGAFLGSQECKIPLQWDNVEESTAEKHLGEEKLNPYSCLFFQSISQKSL